MEKQKSPFEQVETALTNMKKLHRRTAAHKRLLDRYVKKMEMGLHPWEPYPINNRNDLK